MPVIWLAIAWALLVAACEGGASTPGASTREGQDGGGADSDAGAGGDSGLLADGDTLGERRDGDAEAELDPCGLERCNGVDDDCDGLIDEEDAADARVWYRDADGDGFGSDAEAVLACERPAGHVAIPDDCDDSRAATNPSAPDLCNGVDDDCDLMSPDGNAESTFGASCDASDADGCEDGTIRCDDGELFCDEPGPARAESCNGLDDDCDNVIDEGEGVCPTAVSHREGSAYLLMQGAADWAAAWARCESLGYHLVVLGGADEDRWVGTRAGLIAPGAAWWVGLSDEAAEGTFTWVDGRVAWTGGEAVSYTRFGGSGLPGDEGDCVALDLSVGGDWVVADCDDERRFVCEAP